MAKHATFNTGAPDLASEMLDLIGDIYQAGLEPERWPVVIADLSRVFEADMACIYTPLVNRPEQALYLTYNFSAAMESAYTAYFHGIDEWSGTALRQNRYVQGRIALGEDIIPQQELRRTEFYQDFLKHHDMEWIVSSVLFEASPETPATHMTFTRNLERGGYGQDGVRLMQLIAPHVRRALLTHWQLTESRLHQRIHQVGMDSLGYGVALLRSNGAALYLNAFAERILQAADGLTLKAGQILARHAPEQAALLNLLQQAANGLGGGLYLRRDNGAGSVKRPYNLTAIPLQEGHPFRPLADARVMLLIHDPEHTGPLDGLKNFATRHRLTPAETRVLTLLLTDLGPQQIADQLGVGIRTVRSQLSSLYTKTGTKNQRDLIVSALGFGIAVANGNVSGQ